MTEAMAFQPIEATLRDGRRVRIRAIRPDDRDEVVQAFDRLSRESRYTRFMSPLLQVPATVLERTLQLQDAHELGLVAEIDAPDGIDIVAGARYYVLPGGERCEFAVTVADRWQGAGLASRLLRALIQGAGARGLKHMEGFVLAENARMLALARRLGFTVQTDPQDATVMIVRLALTAPAQTDRPEAP
jgi:RimJ/RimL family protein N-acetyltransferase